MLARTILAILIGGSAFGGGLLFFHNRAPQSPARVQPIVPVAEKPAAEPPPVKASHEKYNHIHDALEAEDVGAIEWFLKRESPSDRVRIDFYMKMAVGAGRIKAAEVLLRHGADLNRAGILGDVRALLPLACSSKQRLMAAWLVNKGADVNTKHLLLRETPLTKAVKNRWPEVAFLIMEKQRDLDYGDLLSNTALHIAADTNQADIAERLIDRGANIDAQDSIGFTPLHRAAWSGHANVVALLIRKGADVNKRAYRLKNGQPGLPPMGLLGTMKHPACMRLLREAGARDS